MRQPPIRLTDAQYDLRPADVACWNGLGLPLHRRRSARSIARAGSRSQAISS